MTTIRSQVLSKTAQNKTPSDGLVRVAKACRHLFFPSPISILQVYDEQAAMLKKTAGKPQCNGKLRRWCERGWVRCCERKWTLIILEAVDVHLGRLDGRQGRVDCLAHCRKQSQTLNWFSQSTKLD